MDDPKLSRSLDPHTQHDPNRTLPDDTPADPQTTRLAGQGAGEIQLRSFGDYHLLEEIARGGMGVVYKAHQKSLNRTVALKLIKSGELASQEQVDRFCKEAEAAANLDHSGIVPVYEVGEVDGQHYFTMSFVEGQSLSERLGQGPLPPQSAAEQARAITEAIAYAHSKGVIHRDLKPGNVLITDDGKVRITDFGLAKRIEEDSELTSTGQVLGTPSFMPPEQAEGKLDEIGPAADIYAIGATLYCMLVGHPPFQAANVIETLHHVIETDPVSPRSRNRGIPSDLETVCMKCLEKKPVNRYRSARDLADELDRFLRGEPIRARPIGAALRTLRWCRRKPAAAFALALMFLLSIGGPALWVQLLISNRRAAVSRVETLLRASPSAIPLVLEQLDRDARLVRGRLHRLQNERLTSAERLRLGLALLPSDPAQLDFLITELDRCSYDELVVVLSRIRNQRTSVTPRLWKRVHDRRADQNDRFRAGLALATLEPDAEQWTEADLRLLVQQLLSSNTIHQRAIRQLLAPMAGRLLPPLRRAFRDKTSSELSRVAAANALVAYAGDDVELLAQLLVAATGAQYPILHEAVGELQLGAVIPALRAIAAQTVSPTATQAQRLLRGRERALAALSLLRLGEHDVTEHVLTVGSDPESLTQFVHGCKDRGVNLEELGPCLERFGREQEGGSAAGVPAKASVVHGLLLAMGQYDVTQLSDAKRKRLIDRVERFARRDPRSAVHGAAIWLLRTWGLDELADQIDRTPVAFGSRREWFTLRIPTGRPAESIEVPTVGGTPASVLVARESLQLTFVVFPAGDYLIGSTADEQRQPNSETRHPVHISRPFAVLDREVTYAEMNPSPSGRSHQRRMLLTRYGLSHPVSGVSWYEAVQFCRWLTNLTGLDESDQAYPNPESLDAQEHPIVEERPEWRKYYPVRLGKPGFRLPTETEWEIACRGGTLSKFSFGVDDSLLNQYAWTITNSDERVQPAKRLSPNLRGLFDFHGNLAELCHDHWFGAYPKGKLLDPVGAKRASSRVVRGGPFTMLKSSRFRSANRDSIPAYAREPDVGFRIAFTLTEPGPVSP